KSGEILERLAVEHPDDVALWGELAKLNQRQATNLINARDFSRAHELAERALEAAKRFAAATPQASDGLGLVSVSYTKLGIVQENMNQLDAALESHLSAMQIDRELTVRSPDNTGLQRDMALDWQSMGRVMDLRGDFNSAVEDFQTSITIL